ncbi:hypothetical protein SprV_0100374500 [Sparganum proliferum]
MSAGMMEVERLSSPTIAQMSQTLNVSISDLAELKSEITQLSSTVAALQLRRFPDPPRRSFGRDRRRSRSRPRTANLCWYHVNYGDKARRCVPPCSSKSTQGNSSAREFPRRLRSSGRLSSVTSTRQDNQPHCPGISSSDASRQLAVLDSELENPFRQLLAKYPGLTLPNFNVSIPPHDDVHHIRTTGLHVFSCPRRLAPTRLAAAKAEFEHMLQMGIIRHPRGRFEDGRYHSFGLFEFLRMPFGFRNASQTFQRFVDRVFRGLPFVYAYIDDLLVASSTAEEHMEHLATVFDRLQQFGVVLNPSKCVFGVPSLEFLGHLVDSYGIRPLPSKVAAIRDFPPPTSKRQLQRFLGMVNFYRRFLPNFADTILPLTSLLSGSKRTFELTPAALTSVEQV